MLEYLGREYRQKDFTGKDECRNRGIELHFNKRDHRFSSSDLRKRVCEKLNTLVIYMSVDYLKK